MASDFKSSFIPKEPVTQGPFQKKKTGILGLLSVLLFIVSIIVAGGLYFYKNSLRNDITSLQSELAEAEKSIDKETINELSRFADRLSVVRSIIQRHQAVSNVLNTLSSSTISSVYYTGFSYLDSGNMLQFTLNGRATGYSAVALQEDIFVRNPSFRAVEFSELRLDDRGVVTFDADIFVDPQLVIYSDFINPAPVGTSTGPISPTSANGVRQILQARNL